VPITLGGDDMTGISRRNCATYSNFVVYFTKLFQQLRPYSRTNQLAARGPHPARHVRIWFSQKWFDKKLVIV
jgi:hypothetical protein